MNLYVFVTFGTLKIKERKVKEKNEYSTQN